MNKYKKRLLLFAMACSLFQVNLAYATELTQQPEITEESSNDSAESLETFFEENHSETEEPGMYSDFTELGMEDGEGSSLVYFDETRHIFYDSKNNIYYDENGTVNEVELIELGIIEGNIEDAYKESLAEEKNIQINVSTIFENFEMEESNVYDIYLYITGEPRYVNEEEQAEEYATILLSRSNNFTATTSIDCKDKIFIATGRISNDEVNAYRIAIDEEEYAYKEFNSDNDSCNITVRVSLPEGSITDTNLSPTLSKTDKKYLDGSYGESRRAEIKESMENEPEEVLRKPIKTQNEIHIGAIIFLVIIILLVIGGVYLYIWKKRIEEDDE